MRILILGGDGMLGHQLFRHLKDHHEVRVTLRQEFEVYRTHGLFQESDAYTGLDVRAVERLVDVVADFHPHAIVNCVGLVKQRVEAKAMVPSIEINALLPHRLAALCRAAGARLIHMSTDCVFSGKRGCYTETDVPDAEDLYGRSKLLGEVSKEGCLTLRTSIIGPELSRKTGLLEWFFAQRGKTVQGFRNAIFSGFTTFEMARIIEKLLIDSPHASGLYHISTEPISKHDLLTKINTAFDLGITIVPDDEFKCNRSLDSSRFQTTFGYRPPDWDSMVAELAQKLLSSQSRG